MGWGLLVTSIILFVIALIAVLIFRDGLVECETTENALCPQYMCTLYQPGTKCAIVSDPSNPQFYPATRTSADGTIETSGARVNPTLTPDTTT